LGAEGAGDSRARGRPDPLGSLAGGHPDPLGSPKRGHPNPLGSPARAPNPSGWQRHLEGWPLGAWVVAVCVLTAMLVVPRDVPPVDLPLPRVDRRQQRGDAAVESARAERARAGLPFEVRSVGEAFRRHGRAAFSQIELVPQLVRPLRRSVGQALERQGADRLLELRALQTELLVRAIEEHPLVGSAGEHSSQEHSSGERGADPPSEVVELAGGLLLTGLSHGWFAPPPEGADDGELAALFRVYWGKVLGLSERHPFAPSLNEWRVYYRFLLRAPLPESPDRDRDLAKKLEYVAALAQHDQDYPAALARGIISFQRGAPAEAAMELTAHLELHPDGPWALRARNHLAACGALLIE